MKTKIIPSNDLHQQLFNDVVVILAKYKDTATKIDMLAIASNMVGKILAMQDQAKMTPAEGMELIAKNIEQGNREAIDQLKMETPMGRA